jgi:hypothetical protein
VKSPAKVIALVATAVLVAWYGVVFSIPHNHADGALPQEELACSASHPTSQTSHLHASGQLLSPHPCLACLAGFTGGDLHSGSTVWLADDCESEITVGFAGSRSDHFAHIPLLRGPPVTT